MVRSTLRLRTINGICPHRDSHKAFLLMEHPDWAHAALSRSQKPTVGSSPTHLIGRSDAQASRSRGGCRFSLQGTSNLTQFWLPQKQKRSEEVTRLHWTNIHSLLARAATGTFLPSPNPLSF